MDPVEELRYRVLAIQRDGNRQLAALLKPLGVTPAQGEVLRVLADADGPLTVKQVGEVLVCEPGSPSRLASALVREGLVERGTPPDDARASTLALTKLGDKTARRVREVEDMLHAALRDRLGSERELRDALRLA